MAAGGAALSAGAGAIASAASSLFGSVSGAGDGAASAAPSGGPRPHNSTGARPKRKVILVLQTFSFFHLMWLLILVADHDRFHVSLVKLPQVCLSNDLFLGYFGSWKRAMLHAFFSGLKKFFFISFK